jgi:hypothetical protein
MQASTIETSVSASSSDQTRNYAQRTPLPWRLRLGAALWSLQERWQATKCIWLGACGSFLGRICILSPTEPLVAHCGPAFEVDHLGDHQANTRTIARISYIKKLKALHTWLDIADLRIFLMGFDAGEQFALRTKGNETKIHAEVPASWDTYFPQANKASKGQIFEAIPAAIAGVTRKDECTRTKL